MMQISEPRPARNVLRNASVVLYATLAILWFAIPQSVSNWSWDYLPDFAQPVVAPITNTVETIANLTRIPLLYDAARSAFQAAAKKQ
jgi:hypothetical protein